MNAPRVRIGVDQAYVVGKPPSTPIDGSFTCPYRKDQARHFTLVLSADPRLTPTAAAAAFTSMQSGILRVADRGEERLAQVVCLARADAFDGQ